MDACEVLEKAKEILIEKGWTQGKYRDGEGHYCAYGAIFEAAGVKVSLNGGRSGSPEKFSLSSDAIERFKKANGIMQIGTWNDSFERTKEEVIEAFEKAAC